VLIARLGKVKILNGSEVSPRERRESEIRSVNPFVPVDDFLLVFRASLIYVAGPPWLGDQIELSDNLKLFFPLCELRIFLWVL